MKKTRIILSFIIITLVYLPFVTARQATDVLQTIPPISTSTKTAIAGCTILNVFPGTVIAGTSGYVETNCPNNVASIYLGNQTATSTETPTFLLTTGWTAIGISLTGCTGNPIGLFYNNLLRMNITSGTPVTLLPSGQYSNTILTTGAYNYCLYYNNPSTNGILSFTVSWSP